MVRLIVLREPGLALGWLHREELQPLLVQQELELVRLVQPLDMLVAVARQTNLNVVLAVSRERVVNQRAAARAEGQAFEVLLLREIGRDSDGVAAGRTGWAARSPRG